jgi:uncharacterized membrane protein HdeD (DUF308 family)
MSFMIAVAPVPPSTARALVGTVAAFAALALILGVVTLTWPTVTLLIIAALFGIYAIVNGVMLLVASIRRWVPNRVSSALFGVIDLAAGIIAIAWPGVTVLVLAVLVGVWLIVTGVFESVLVTRLWRETHEVRTVAWPTIRAALAMIVGILVIARPVAGAWGIALLIGVYALIYAGVLGAIAWQLRRITHGRRRTANPSPADPGVSLA